MFDSKTLAAALIAGALLSTTGANAQTAALVEVPDATLIPLINADADALEDLHIYNAAGEKIGEVEEVLGTDASTATAVAVDFDSSAGFGREDRVVPLDNLTLKGVKLTLGLDATAVAALPVYDD